MCQKTEYAPLSGLFIGPNSWRRIYMPGTNPASIVRWRQRLHLFQLPSTELSDSWRLGHVVPNDAFSHLVDLDDPTNFLGEICDFASTLAHLWLWSSISHLLHLGRSITNPHLDFGAPRGRLGDKRRYGNYCKRLHGHQIDRSGLGRSLDRGCRNGDWLRSELLLRDRSRRGWCWLRFGLGGWLKRDLF